MLKKSNGKRSDPVIYLHVYMQLYRYRHCMSVFMQRAKIYLADKFSTKKKDSYDSTVRPTPKKL